MTPRRKIFTFAIDSDLAEGLKEIKRQFGIPESEQVRRAIAFWIEQQRRLAPKSLSVLTREESGTSKAPRRGARTPRRG